MKIKYYFAIAALFSLMLWSCDSNQPSTGKNSPSSNSGQTQTNEPTKNQAADDSKGIGKFKDVPMTHPLDDNMIAGGKKIYDLKCSACHKLTADKLVGPGWLGVTDRRKPEWIMNFATNTDEMINKDPNAQALLEQCMVRMPNQNLSDVDVRNIVEFMRKNDGKN